MMELYVDRLTLDASELSELDGRRLARLVAEQLAVVNPPGAPLSTDRLRLAVTPQRGESLQSMAQRIAEEMLHALGRSP
jgi:hypothetical protein